MFPWIGRKGRTPRKRNARSYDLPFGNSNSPHQPPAAVECLESRLLLAAATAWPSAPFGRPSYEDTIFVNQLGTAVIDNKTIAPAGDVDTYGVYWDDDGTLSFRVTGSAPTDVAFYQSEGQPARASAAGTIAGSAVFSKQMYYIGVKAHTPGAMASYSLEVNGVPHNVIRHMPISERTQGGSWVSFIGGDNDTDFFDFTATQSGEWLITVVPMATTKRFPDPLDATMNVYDAAGNPLAGTFTTAVNQTGANGTESYTLANVAAGQKLFIRVDGNLDSAGWYRVSAKHVGPPIVSVTANDAMGSEIGPNRAQFTITRSEKSNLPLTVNYTLNGTATNGRDYARLTGTATIRAGQRSALVTVRPLRDRLKEGFETVKLHLATGDGYTIGSKNLAGIKISEQRIVDLDLGPWPAAALRSSSFDDTVYINQAGDARVTGVFSKPSSFEGFSVDFDDSGPVTVSVSGSAGPQLAYYDGPGTPDQTKAAGSTSTRVSAKVGADKHAVYLGVRPRDAATTGGYTLSIDGPTQRYIEEIRIDSDDHAGASGSDISGAGDCDFYRFTPTKSGNWMVRVIPDAPGKIYSTRLDATMSVFDSDGNPIGGTFTLPVNDGAAGHIETWVGNALQPGKVYFVRVDGLGSSVGGYGISAFLSGAPTVTVVAKVASTTEGSTQPARYLISRSESDGKPLAVKYSLAGTALSGQDFRALAGSVTIPATATSALLTIAPIADGVLENTETVVLTLLPSPRYGVGARNTATATIANRGGK